MDDRVTRTRLNTCDDVDSWVQSFNKDLETNVNHPENELFNPGQKFCDWRLSYGIRSRVEGAAVYFLAIYPPFCRSPKASYHYRNIAELATDVMTLENFLVGVESPTEVDAQDIIACAFALSRNKESFELFQEQKDLMSWGLHHFRLDNYYQDSIKKLTSEYYDRGTILGKKFNLTFLGAGCRS